MENIDWNNPPDKLRFLVDSHTRKVIYINDEINQAEYDTLQGIKETFASGQGLVNIVLSENGPSSKWKLIPKSHADYLGEGKKGMSRIHLIYEKIE